MKKKRVIILGGGFGGIYAALEFEKRQDPDFEVTLISQDNFFLFTSMLHEVAASDLDLTHIVNPISEDAALCSSSSKQKFDPSTL